MDMVHATQEDPAHNVPIPLHQWVPITASIV